jgi:hypothetical protein
VSVNRDDGMREVTHLDERRARRASRAPGASAEGVQASVAAPSSTPTFHVTHLPPAAPRATHAQVSSSSASLSVEDKVPALRYAAEVFDETAGWRARLGAWLCRREYRRRLKQRKVG